MKHIDITLDFETCAIGANAAVIQLAAVAWDRHAGANPFILTDNNGKMCNSTILETGEPENETFNQRFDLTDQVFRGRDFDPNTIRWWADKKKDEVKKGILALEPMATADVLYNFREWIMALMKETGAQTVCLWSQGTDFDIAILRNLCEQYGIDMPRNIYKNFRDARTYIMEAGAVCVLDEKDTDAQHRDPNVLYNELTARYGQHTSDPAMVHDALYDSLRTTWNVWNIYLCLVDDYKDYMSLSERVMHGDSESSEA